MKNAPNIKKIITEYSVSPGTPFPERHSSILEQHSHREILFVLEGNSRFLYNGQIFDAHPGTAFFINSRESHSYGYEKEDDQLLHLWVHLSAERITAVVLRIAKGEYFPEKVFQPLTRDICLLVNQRWDKALSDIPNGFRDEILRLNLSLLLQEFSLQDYEPQNAGEKTHDIVLFIEHHIELMHGRDCSLKRLEKITGFNRFYLAHLFKSKKEMTIGDYINRVRKSFMTEAVKRGIPQKKIAEEMGFSSPSAFCTWKRLQGASPLSAGRRKNMNSK